jgi:hypothetical protein
MSSAADWYRPTKIAVPRRKTTGRVVRVHQSAQRVFSDLWKNGPMAVSPPMDVVGDLMASPALPLPPLDRIVSAPIFSSHGTLQVEPGYQAATRTYFAHSRSTRLREQRRPRPKRSSSWTRGLP